MNSVVKLNYKSFGQGEPVIILHGLFGMLDNWQTIAKKLAKEYQVFIVDQRNHGRSPHVDEIDYELMAEDLNEFMTDNWIYKARIIGHSMGGKTAMQFALAYPDMVEQLVVVDIGPKSYEGGHQNIFEAMFDLDLNNIPDRKVADHLLEKRIKENSVRQFLLKNLNRTPEGNFRWKMNLPSIYKAYQKILDNPLGDEQFDGPTLFIRGGKSGYLSENDLPILQKWFPEAEMKTIEDSGHWVHAEQPEAFREMVERFFVDLRLSS